MSAKPFHDIKTERQDITRPLPRVLILVPVMFCISCVAAIALNLLFFFKIKESEAAKVEWHEKIEEETLRKSETEKQIGLIKDEDRRAKDMYDWVEGSRQIQPLAVGVARSMSVKSSIEELSLVRGMENPHQIRIGLDFVNGGQKQLDSTLSAINDLGYRAYSANQTSGQGGQVDYQATLIWQKVGNKNNNLSLNNNE
ncbi:MAG: hypothetical protein P8I97_09490 [Verrucomicrobiales bacterium]|nr:hypothetical protein [Verrucomicrobiales bacterium]